MLWSTSEGLRAGLLALFCAVVGLWASEMHNYRRLALGLASAFAAELSHVERAEDLVARFGSALEYLERRGHTAVDGRGGPQGGRRALTRTSRG